jgi:uncharacterized damage-inducible protein DinB
MPAFFSFQQVREDLAQHTAGITRDQLWSPMAGKHSLGYHLKHIAGSVDRLTTYLVGKQLIREQLEFLQTEHESESELDELLALVSGNLDAAQRSLLQIKPESLYEPRFVGRQKLPTTVLGLIVHVCEHTQRHLGQAILISKLLRNS